MALENVLVVHWAPGFHRLKDEIFRPSGFYEFVISNCPARPDFDEESFQPKHASDHFERYTDRRGARPGFRFRPVSSTVALFNGDRIGVDATPLQSDKFTDSKAGPHRDEYHARVRFRHELNELVELFWRDGRFRLRRTFVEWQSQSFHGSLDQVIHVDGTA